MHMQFTSPHMVHGSVGAQSHLACHYISRSLSIIIQNLSGNGVLQNHSFPFTETFSPFLNLGDFSGAWQSYRSWVGHASSY